MGVGEGLEAVVVVLEEAFLVGADDGADGVFGGDMDGDGVAAEGDGAVGGVAELFAPQEGAWGGAWEDVGRVEGEAVSAVVSPVVDEWEEFWELVSECRGVADFECGDAVLGGVVEGGEGVVGADPEREVAERGVGDGGLDGLLGEVRGGEDAVVDGVCPDGVEEALEPLVKSEAVDGGGEEGDAAVPVADAGAGEAEGAAVVVALDEADSTGLKKVRLSA